MDRYDWRSFPNISIMSPIEYQRLPADAIFFGVATIPFLKNEITESTSPIKLFEYMAMGHPIVTTDLHECRKSPPVLIGKNEQDFIAKIDLALEKRHDPAYLAALDKVARDNTWEKKVADLVSLISPRLLPEQRAQAT